MEDKIIITKSPNFDIDFRNLALISKLPSLSLSLDIDKKYIKFINDNGINDNIGDGINGNTIDGINGNTIDGINGNTIDGINDNVINDNIGDDNIGNYKLINFQLVDLKDEKNIITEDNIFARKDENLVGVALFYFPGNTFTGGEIVFQIEEEDQELTYIIHPAKFTELTLLTFSHNLPFKIQPTNIPLTILSAQIIKDN